MGFSKGIRVQGLRLHTPSLGVQRSNTAFIVMMEENLVATITWGCGFRVRGDLFSGRCIYVLYLLNPKP